ncbi:hypothetical protein AArcMg_1380 [Natrarchaeobaculum sulfurireducens]|uniref:Polyketide cyclase/dehydrase n=1 Tax=Natrarchaeobaculum sulfurireducens TaxID=2044521 RepID=A0A346PPF0_9EURY|nr:hypothetical protein AArcMg_1380 [Natrarchaeobaculum sulfurireducens]
MIAAAPDDAWEVLVDTTRWPTWSPVIFGVDATDRYVRTGTSGRVRAPGVWLPFTGTSGRVRAPGVWLPFTVTDCRERSWTWRVAELPGATHRVDELGTDRCRVVFELPPASVGAAPVCLEALERIDAVLEDSEST